MNEIIGIGTDLIEVSRIRRAIENNPARFRTRTFTEGEVQYCEKRKNKFEHYAARFAAKEAAMKALGTGGQEGIRFSDIEVINNTSGKPDLIFHGKAKEKLKALGHTGAFISLSHTREYAMACAILTKEPAG